METLKNPGFNFPVISGFAAIIVTGMLLIFIAGLSEIKPTINIEPTEPVIIKYTRPPELLDPVKEEVTNPKPAEPINRVIRPVTIYDIVPTDPFTSINIPGTIKITTIQTGKVITGPARIREIFTLRQVDRPPRILRPVTPVYPFDAKKKGIQGRVVLRFIVDENGIVQMPQVVSADPEGVFEEAALAAIGKYKFDPAVIGNKKVKCSAVLPIGFRLN